MTNKTYELVKIVDPEKKDDFLLIAEQDFDAKKHTLFDDGSKGKQAKKGISE